MTEKPTTNIKDLPYAVELSNDDSTIVIQENTHTAQSTLKDISDFVLNKLTAGDNITIENGVISTTSDVTKEYVDEQNAIQDTEIDAVKSDLSELDNAISSINNKIHTPTNVSMTSFSAKIQNDRLVGTAKFRNMSMAYGLCYLLFTGCMDVDEEVVYINFQEDWIFIAKSTVNFDIAIPKSLTQGDSTKLLVSVRTPFGAGLYEAEKIIEIVK